MGAVRQPLCLTCGSAPRTAGGPPPLQVVCTIRCCQPGRLGKESLGDQHLSMKTEGRLQGGSAYLLPAPPGKDVSRDPRVVTGRELESTTSQCPQHAELKLVWPQQRQPDNSAGSGKPKVSRSLKRPSNFPKCKIPSFLEPVMPFNNPALLPLGASRSCRGTRPLFYSGAAQGLSLPLILSLKSLPFLPFLLLLCLSLLYNLTIPELKQKWGRHFNLGQVSSALTSTRLTSFHNSKSKWNGSHAAHRL